MYALKALFFMLLLCNNVDVVEGRRLALDVALDDMRNQLQDAATLTELINTDNDYTTVYGLEFEHYTESPMVTIITSTSVMDALVGAIVTPAAFPAEITSDINSHSSLVRAVLNSISQECSWGEECCANLETEVAQVINHARLLKGSAGPQMHDAASVLYMVVCIVFVIGGLTGLVLLLDRFLPSEAVYGGLSYVGHTVVDLVSGVWRFLFRRHVARTQVVEPMTARLDGELRPMAVVEPEPSAAYPGAAVYPVLHPAVFQVIYFFLFSWRRGKIMSGLFYRFIIQLGRGFVHMGSRACVWCSYPYVFTLRQKKIEIEKVYIKFK